MSYTIQSAYWSLSQVMIYPVVAYYKFSKKLLHQSLVFLSDKQSHDAKFVFALTQKLVPVLESLILNVEFIHCWINSHSFCRNEYLNLS